MTKKKVITRNKALDLLAEVYSNIDKEILVDMVIEFMTEYSSDGRMTNKGLAKELEDEGLGEYEVVDDSVAAGVLFDE